MQLPRRERFGHLNNEYGAIWSPDQTTIAAVMPLFSKGFPDEFTRWKLFMIYLPYLVIPLLIAVVLAVEARWFLGQALNRFEIPPRLMSIHTHGRPCSDRGRVLVLNDPPARRNRSGRKAAAAASQRASRYS
jgi:hypothetical protein